MRDLTKGKKPIPIKPTKAWGIYGAEELVFEYDTREQAEKALAALLAPTTHRWYENKRVPLAKPEPVKFTFTIRKIS